MTHIQLACTSSHTPSSHSFLFLPHFDFCHLSCPHTKNSLTACFYREYKNRLLLWDGTTILPKKSLKRIYVVSTTGRGDMK